MIACAITQRREDEDEDDNEAGCSAALLCCSIFARLLQPQLIQKLTLTQALEYSTNCRITDATAYHATRAPR